MNRNIGQRYCVEDNCAWRRKVELQM